jgi:hypothetical protein
MKHAHTRTHTPSSKPERPTAISKKPGRRDKKLERFDFQKPSRSAPVVPHDDLLEIDASVLQILLGDVESSVRDPVECLLQSF